jgi:hypothetical protein
MTLRAMGRSSISVSRRLDTIAFQMGCEPERETGLAEVTAGPVSARSFLPEQYRPN